MSYTPGDLFVAMGRKWWCDDDFTYSLSPNLRYSPPSITTMLNEWEWRVRRHEVCMERCALAGIPIPKQRARTMPRETPQQLEAALFRAREEENRMNLRLHRQSLYDDAKMFREEGDRFKEQQYLALVTTPDYYSDSVMSSEDD